LLRNFLYPLQKRKTKQSPGGREIGSRKWMIWLIVSWPRSRHLESVKDNSYLLFPRSQLKSRSQSSLESVP
jgi:hypothetical protein